MRLLLQWLVCLLFVTGAYGQPVSMEKFTRTIKVNKDSLPPLKAAVTKKLAELTAGTKSNDGTIRILVTTADKQTAPDISRWLAIRQKKDIFQVSLAGLVSKYIGETEKNLERVFSKASEGNMILFFDEADALFGKRSADAAGQEDRQNAIRYFIKQTEALKGTVIIRCTAENCSSTLAKLRFTGFSG